MEEKRQKELVEAVDAAIKVSIAGLNKEPKHSNVSELIRLLELHKELKREDVKFVTVTWIEPEN